MRNIVLFEGIASSGKTTVERLLAARLPDSILMSEDETLMPIIDNKDMGVARMHLQKQLQKIIENPAKNVIIDRFHFTHAFRTQSDLNVFSDIEDKLKSIGNVLVILLTIDPDHIKERIEETILRRKDKWKKGVQGSIEEKVEYYTKQQMTLGSFVSKSHLSSMTINTTDKKWDEYVDSIARHFERPPRVLTDVTQSLSLRGQQR